MVGTLDEILSAVMQERLWYRDVKWINTDRAAQYVKLHKRGKLSVKMKEKLAVGLGVVKIAEERVIPSVWQMKTPFFMIEKEKLRCKLGLA